ncbi:NAD(P)-binding protein [Herbiconiux sp. SYSU D00978]|uniref:NAD(P)-binding protein n=1 Tax=Herbiconiux sp. SYSU D00978 TaxID=2812562 RepID=UPI001F62553A|nr:NAD(P)/FAD-dependent oxidoreductase [Herbiconiux sp. SYSU D00978]
MPSTAVEHLDVLIVGAGISGIGAAHAVQTRTSRSYAILEARSALGGTWDLFRYPGIRSDSDLYTFGFDFRPWREDESIASADRILAYLQDTAREHGIDRRIRFSHRVVAARWDSPEARWHVDVERTDTGERVALTANWLFGATGTTATTGASRRASRAGSRSADASCTRRRGRPTSTTGAAASS